MRSLMQVAKAHPSVVFASFILHGIRRSPKLCSGRVQVVRRQSHEAAVGVRAEASVGDEFELIKKYTREYLERPKKEREPFLRNLFIRKIDPTILEYPQLHDDALKELVNHVEPVINRMKSEVDPHKIDANETIPNDLLDDLSNYGAFVHTISREYDGNGLDLVGYTRMVESLSLNGNVTVGAFSYLLGSWASKIVSKHCTEEQKAFYLPQIASGNVTCSVCIAEAESGSDVASMRCSVRLGPDNRGYIITGKKSWVVNAHKADCFIVIAKHEGLGQYIKQDDKVKEFEQQREKKGSMSAFLVSKKASGIVLGDPKDFVGLRGLQVSEVIFDNVAIGLDSLVGATGGGFEVAMDAVAGERHIIASAALPLLRQLIDKAAKHCVDRELFNRSLSSFDMIREKLVESAFLTYALESMTYLTSLLIDQTVKPEFDMEAAAVRVFMGDILPRCILNCSQIFGAAGVEMDSDLDLAFRDALTLCHLDGGTDIARLYVALTGLQYAGFQQMDRIHKINNPFNYPWYNLRRYMEYETMTERKYKKRTVFLEDYVHPSLMEGAKHLEDRCNDVSRCIESLLVKHNKELIHQQMDLRRIADAVILLYGCFASLGRASRSYCIGLRNGEHEMGLALMFCQYADQKIGNIYQEIKEDSHGRDYGIRSAMQFISANKGYCVEHPLARNY